MVALASTFSPFRLRGSAPLARLKVPVRVYFTWAKTAGEETASSKIAMTGVWDKRRWERFMTIVAGNQPSIHRTFRAMRVAPRLTRYWYQRIGPHDLFPTAGYDLLEFMIDLHTHTTASDGSVSPPDLVRLA